MTVKTHGSLFAVAVVSCFAGVEVAGHQQILESSITRTHPYTENGFNRNSKKASEFNGFLQRKKSVDNKNKNKADPIEVFSQPSYGTGGEACCACFFARKRTPEHMGISDMVANVLTCDTCYVADVHDVDAVDKAMAGVKAAGTVGDHSSAFDAVQGARGVKFDATAGSLEQCKINCDADPSCGVFAFYDRDQECHLIKPASAMPAMWESPSENMFQDFFPGIAYYKKGGMIPANPTTAYNIVAASRQEAVSEWNWSCVPGVAPTDKPSWAAPMVDGEPPSREVYHLCGEEKYFCPGPADQDDLSKGLDAMPHNHPGKNPWDSALGDVDPYALEGLLPKISQPWEQEE